MSKSPALEVRIISIGAMAAHPLWEEKGERRTGHATTTLVRAAGRVILVDPGLPEQMLAARLDERAGLKPADITDVFLTTFKPETMRGINAFGEARWHISETEREHVGVTRVHMLQEAASHDDDEVKRLLERQVAILKRCRAAADALAEGVDLFPLPGVTAGACGLLIAEPARTTLVCGDAVPTLEHLERGMVLQGAEDVDTARASFAEAVEIADVLIPGRDNWVINPLKRPF